MTNKNSRSTNNPYLTGITQEQATSMTLGSELKRLLGSPLRLLETLFFTLAPLLLSLAGALDLLTGWLYTVTYHAELDDRPTVKLVDCLLDETKTLCQGEVWASPGSSQRIVLYPWHDWDLINKFEPGLFMAFFALAVIGFVSIGNPRFKQMGRTLALVFGRGEASGHSKANARLGLIFKDEGNNKNKHKGKSGNKGEDDGQLKAPWLIPALELDDKADPRKLAQGWETSLLLGGYMPRMWESDPGYFYLNHNQPPVPYWLTLSMLRTNLVIVAPQGSGKTHSIYRPMLNFLRRSNSVGIFWDSKGDDFDAEFFDYNFNPDDPDHSIRLNILAGSSPIQAGERLGEALVPDLPGDKQYFSNNAKDAMAALTAAHAASFGRNPGLVDLLDYLSNPARVQSLHDKMLKTLTAPDQREEGLRLATLLRRVIQLADNKTTDVLGSLAAALSPLVTGPAARVLTTNSDTGSYTIEELLKKPGLVRLALPVAKSPRIAPILGRLVLAQFTYAVLSPDCNRNIFKMAAVDEARHFITENAANGMAQARSNNAGYALALQSLTQIRDETLLDTIFAVSGTKIVMAGVGEKDARRFSDTFGQLELPYVTHSEGSSSGTSRNTGSGFSRGQEYEFFGGQSGRESRSSRSGSNTRGRTQSHNENSMTTSRMRPRFFPAELRELQQYQAVVESSDARGRRWFAQVIDMRAATVHDLESKVLNHLNRLGMEKASKQKGNQPVNSTDLLAAYAQPFESEIEGEGDRTIPAPLAPAQVGRNVNTPGVGPGQSSGRVRQKPYTIRFGVSPDPVPAPEPATTPAKRHQSEPAIQPETGPEAIPLKTGPLKEVTAAQGWLAPGTPPGQTSISDPLESVSVSTPSNPVMSTPLGEVQAKLDPVSDALAQIATEKEVDAEVEAKKKAEQIREDGDKSELYVQTALVTQTGKKSDKPRKQPDVKSETVDPSNMAGQVSKSEGDKTPVEKPAYTPTHSQAQNQEQDPAQVPVPVPVEPIAKAEPGPVETEAAEQPTGPKAKRGSSSSAVSGSNASRNVIGEL